MSGAHKARLARAVASAASADWAEIAERHRLSAIATIAGAVRHALRAQGIDPACSTQLRDAETAEAALAALPDPPETNDDDAAEADPDALDDFVAETERRASRYASDRPIDLATAPLADLLAWCIAQGWITLQRDGSENLLLIRCKPLEGSPEAPPDGADSTNKTIGLSPPNPDLSTEAREFF